MKIRDILTTLVEKPLSEYRQGGDELNPKISVNAAVAREYDAAEKIGPGVKNLFVSFTDLEKLGVNPHSGFKTPVGVYAYTSEYVVQAINQNAHPSHELPYAGDRPYANTLSLKPDANVLFIDSTTDVDQYYDQLRNWYGDEEIDALIAASNQSARRPSVGGRFWYVLHTLSNNSKLWPNSGYKNPAVRWTHLLRRLGIDAVIDVGAGIIHPNEPSQIVVVNPAVITNVHRHYNKYSPDTSSSKREVSATQQQLKQEYLSVKDDYDKLLHWLTLERAGEWPRPRLSRADFFKFVSPDWRAKMLLEVPALSDFIINPTLSDAQAILQRAVLQMHPSTQTPIPSWVAGDLSQERPIGGSYPIKLRNLLLGNPKMVIAALSNLEPVWDIPSSTPFGSVSTLEHLLDSPNLGSIAMEFYTTFLRALPVLAQEVLHAAPSQHIPALLDIAIKQAESSGNTSIIPGLRKTAQLWLTPPPFSKKARDAAPGIDVDDVPF